MSKRMHSSSTDDDSSPSHKAPRLGVINSNYIQSLTDRLEALNIILDLNVTTTQNIAFFTQATPLVVKSACTALGKKTTNKNKHSRIHLLSDVLGLFTAVDPFSSADFNSQTSNPDVVLTSLPTAPSLHAFQTPPEELTMQSTSMGRTLTDLANLNTHSHKQQTSAFRRGIVTAVRAVPKLHRQARQFKPTEKCIYTLHKAFAQMRRKESNKYWKDLRNKPGGLGVALNGLNLLPPGFSIIPTFARKIEDTERFMSHVIQQCKQNISSSEQSLDANVVVKVFVPDLQSWRPAIIVDVARDGDNHVFAEASANVLMRNGEVPVLVEHIERRSIAVEVMPVQKIDKATASWFDPSFIRYAADKWGLGIREDEEKLWIFLLDGTGARKSETEGHHDVTISGVIPASGGHLDSSIYTMIVDMLATSKDSKLIWDAHFSAWAERWEKELRDTGDISISLLDMKALWDTMACLKVKHIDTHPDDPHHNVPKGLTQVYCYETHSKPILAFPNKSKAFIELINNEFPEYTRFFNIEGEWSWRHEPWMVFHGPLHYGRFVAIDLGLALTGAEMSGGEAFVKQFLRHSRTCCRMELDKHSDRCMDASGLINYAVRKGVGAMWRQSFHPNFIPLPTCEKCQMVWPEKGLAILECLRVLFLCSRRARIGFNTYDLEKQLEFSKSAMTRADLVNCLQAEMRNSKLWKISSRNHATEGIRLLTLCNNISQPIGGTTEQAIEAAHIGIVKTTYQQGANLGLGKCNLASKEKFGKIAITVRLEETEAAQSDRVKLEAAAKKRHETKDKKKYTRLENADRLMFEHICIDGNRTTDASMLRKYWLAYRGEEDAEHDDGSNKKNASSESSDSNSSEEESSSNSDSDKSSVDESSSSSSSEDSSLSSDEESENLDQEEEEADMNDVDSDVGEMPPAFDVLKQVSKQVQMIQAQFSDAEEQKLADTKKTLFKLTIKGGSKNISFPLTINLNGDVNESIITTSGTTFQQTYLWTMQETTKLNVLVSDIEVRPGDTKKAYNRTYGIQIAPGNVKVWNLDEATTTLHIKLINTPKLISSNSRSISTDPTGGCFVGVGLEIIATTGSEEEWIELKAYIRYLQKNYLWPKVKAETLELYTNLCNNINVQNVEDEGDVDESKTNDGTEETFENEMLAQCTPLVNRNVLNFMCRRQQMYEDPSSYNSSQDPKFGWKIWACACTKRPIKVTNDDYKVTESDCTPSHWVGVHYDKTDGIPVRLDSPIVTSETMGGVEHLICKECHIPIGQLVRDNNNRLMTDPEKRKLLLLGLDCVTDAQAPAAPGATRARVPTARAAAAAAVIAQRAAATAANAAAAANAAVNAAANAAGQPQIVVPPPAAIPISTTCLGVNGGACSRLKKKKDGVLGGLCAKCPLLALKLALSQATSYYNSSEELVNPTWLQEVTSFVANPKGGIGPIRCYYCLIITEMKKETLRLDNAMR